MDEHTDPDKTPAHEGPVSGIMVWSIHMGSGADVQQGYGIHRDVEHSEP